MLYQQLDPHTSSHMVIKLEPHLEPRVINMHVGNPFSQKATRPAAHNTHMCYVAVCRSVYVVIHCVRLHSQ